MLCLLNITIADPGFLIFIEEMYLEKCSPKKLLMLSLVASTGISAKYNTSFSSIIILLESIIILNFIINYLK